MLSNELLDRLRERALDPERCNDNASISGQTMDLETMLGHLGAAGGQFKAMQGQIGGLMGQFAAVMQGLGVANPLPQPAEAKASQREANKVPPPASAEALTKAEQDLGFCLPDDLRQLYAIADGGFGPRQGLYRLAELVRIYHDFTSEPFGPQGQAWPAKLIPIIHDDPGELCLDRETGRILFWDPEELAEGPSNKFWVKSFKDDADSLAALFQKWVDEPTVIEQMGQPVQPPPDGWDPMETHIRNMIESCGRMTPEERAALGFGGDDWAEQIRRTYS